MTTGLPIEDVIGDVTAALAGPGVAVLVASPGAGKTTVVPIRLLDQPWMAGGKLLVLEPRRVATRAAARRMASLLGEQVGATVGYTTRDDRKTSRQTRVEVVTDGILTRRIQHDPELAGVAGIVFDEFHERRVQSDLGLAFALDVRRSIRPDLRILVMSATIAADRVAALVGDDGPARVIESTGRAFDVAVRWRPTDLPTGRRRGRALAPGTVAAVIEALDQTDGDVLTFLPGIGEIRAVDDGLRGGLPRDTDVRVLHGSLPAAEQDAAITAAPTGRRKVVLATDVAETSLTVEGITAVVDAGMQRTPRFDAGSGLSRLVTVAASKASATQRSGRAGRLAPGVAYRLWSEVEHASRVDHTPAEITAVDLASVVLEVAAWGAELAELALLDQPGDGAIAEATELLGLLGALDSRGRLTNEGKAMAALPLHPRTAAVVLAASKRARGRAAQIAALIEEGDVLRGRPGTIDSDLELRLRLLDDRERRHPDASGARMAQVRRRAKELSRRADGLPTGLTEQTAGLLAAGYPDRLAQRRSGQRGRFLMRNGTGAFVEDHDPIADAEFCVAADVEGGAGDSRIRLAAGLVEADLPASALEGVETVERLEWNSDRRDLFVRVERRLGAIVLASSDRRPEAGAATCAALSDALEVEGIDLLAPSKAARAFQTRLQFLHERLGGDWPDVSDAGLVAARAAWFEFAAGRAVSRRDLERIDLTQVIRGLLEPHHHRLVDELVPERLTLPSGRHALIDYPRGGEPTVRAKVQELFGLTATPTVAAGAVRILFDLRSPADRTIQLTSDLAGFWDGSWVEVRKEMAGRYPKHDWPEHPTEVPSRSRTRRTDT